MFYQNDQEEPYGDQQLDSEQVVKTLTGSNGSQVAASLGSAGNKSFEQQPPPSVVPPANKSEKLQNKQPDAKLQLEKEIGLEKNLNEFKEDFAHEWTSKVSQFHAGDGIGGHFGGPYEQPPPGKRPQEPVKPMHQPTPMHPLGHPNGFHPLHPAGGGRPLPFHPAGAGPHGHPGQHDHPGPHGHPGLHGHPGPAGGHGGPGPAGGHGGPGPAGPHTPHLNPLPFNPLDQPPSPHHARPGPVVYQCCKYVFPADLMQDHMLYMLRHNGPADQAFAPPSPPPVEFDGPLKQSLEEPPKSAKLENAPDEPKPGAEPEEANFEATFHRPRFAAFDQPGLNYGSCVPIYQLPASQRPPSSRKAPFLFTLFRKPLFG